MPQIQKFKIKPYARLLTMLGDQLIKNERIALMELIKNSYDADADWVKVSFIGFDKNYVRRPESKIVVEDSGHGMTYKTIINSWLNPATPNKKNIKEVKERTKKGRILQGEKGIGRFAILKLGRIITIITRPEGEDKEYVITYDFSMYDDEFLSLKDKKTTLFLDQLPVFVSTRKPQVIIQESILLGVKKIKRVPYGTRIEISNLKSNWSESKIHDVYRDIARLQPIFTLKNNKKTEFDVLIYKDAENQNFQNDYIEKLQFLLEERSVFKVENGKFDDLKKTFSFDLNGIRTELCLDHPDILKDIFFKKRFSDEKNPHPQIISCGPFEFAFYTFDFSAQAPPKYALDNSDKEILKMHRIYLYRDGIRVYPYGDPEDDWLRIDATRGTISASKFLSNDQVVGYVNISQKNNPNLKDKTNREGLIDQGGASEDFIALLQTILSYIRKKPYARYRIGLKEQKSHEIFREERIQKRFEELKAIVPKDKYIQDVIASTEKDYKAERLYLLQRAETTEELAGVGLSVETASHDIIGIMSKVFANLDGLIKDIISASELDREEILKELQSIRGGMGFIEAQLKDIQLLFKSSKQRRKSIRVKEIVEKVERIYKRLLEKEKIKYNVRIVGSPLVAKTTDAVLLQLLLNLFDNAVYWLKETNNLEKKIEILLDGDKCQLIFSDNGPGVSKDDAAYIFEPFYSGKGDEGRGLGLYIARQLLERNDYSIDLAELRSERILSGANFVVNFTSEE